jgi:hypothetical protein
MSTVLPASFPGTWSFISASLGISVFLMMRMCGVGRQVKEKGCYKVQISLAGFFLITLGFGG